MVPIQILSLQFSSGWLKKWKQRHGISQVKINGEIKSADTVEGFIPKFQQFIEEQRLTDEMIYNADGTALYKILPDRTLAMKKDKTSKEGYKQVKDRLTLLQLDMSTQAHTSVYWEVWMFPQQQHVIITSGLHIQQECMDDCSNLWEVVSPDVHPWCP